ncbi:hypothetical protein AB0933_32290 [Streptomyces venezuelae]|uniref:hypothetical protein n=1 Tax=Streptomyces venezuelae TaxID=54571 RepID=UPI003456CF4B
MPAHDDEFHQIVSGFSGPHQPECPPTGPYGAPETPTRPGLTRRGKAALAVTAAVLGSSTLIGYQIHSSNAAEAEAKAQEIQLKADALELEKLRELNRAREVNRKTSTSSEQARQADIDACVKSNADEIGKGFGSTRRDLVDACQAQYSTGSEGEDMAAAGSSKSASGGGSSIDINTSLLLGAGGAALVVFLVSRGRRHTAD